MVEQGGQDAISTGASLAMFGAVAMMMTRWQRQSSSSEDLGGSGFDAEHLEHEHFVQTIPKIELHVHLDGAFDPGQLWAHLLKYPDLVYCFPTEKTLPWFKPDQKPLPLRSMVEECNSAIDYRRLCTCRRRYRKLRHADSGKPPMPKGRSPPGTLEDMLTCFEFFFPLVYGNLELLENLAFDFVKRQYEQHVIYTEVRYSPHLLAEDPWKSHAAITNGLRKGCEKYRVVVNQILCGINFAPEWADDIVEMAHVHREDFPCAVVGVDVAAGEDHFTAGAFMQEAHLEMCRKAQELELNITLHAGETPNSGHNVRKAIEEYGAKRIGHGYHITSHPDIMELVKERNVHMEVCPTSSVETGGWRKGEWRDHPAAIFRDRGLSMSFSSDDPAVFNTSLTWQYRIALKKMGWDAEDVLATIDAAIDASFAPSSEKNRLRERLRESRLATNPAFSDRVHYD